MGKKSKRLPRPQKKSTNNDPAPANTNENELEGAEGADAGDADDLPIEELSLNDENEDHKNEDYENQSKCPHLHTASLAGFERALSGKLTCEVCGNTNRQKRAPKSKSNANPVLRICLTCGNVGCCPPFDHSQMHHNSNPKHALFLITQNRRIQCLTCEEEVVIGGGPEYDTISQCIMGLNDFVPPPSSSAPKVGKYHYMKNNKALRQEKQKSYFTKNKEKEKEEVYEDNTAMDSTLGGQGNGVKGLSNLGNTCFFNSVLQNFAHTIPLRERLLPPSETKESFGPLSEAMTAFMRTMWAAGTGKISPGNLFSQVCKKAPRFKGFRQQDSHELLRYLFDGLLTEEHDHYKARNVKHPSTFIESTFGGKLCSTVTCLECKTASKTLEPFLDLSLPIPIPMDIEVIPDRKKKRRGGGGGGGETKFSYKQARELNKKQLAAAKREAKLRAVEHDEITINGVPYTPTETTTETETTTTTTTTTENIEENNNTENNNIENDENEPDGADLPPPDGADEMPTYNNDDVIDTPPQQHNHTNGATDGADTDGAGPSSPRSNGADRTGRTSPQQQNHTNNNTTTNITSSSSPRITSSSSASPSPLPPRPTTITSYEPIDLRRSIQDHSRSDGKLTLLDSIISFTDPELLDGDNSFKCAECTRRYVAHGGTVFRSNNNNNNKKSTKNTKSNNNNNNNNNNQPTNDNNNKDSDDVALQSDDVNTTTTPRSTSSDNDDVADNNSDDVSGAISDDESSSSGDEELLKKPATKQYMINQLPPILTFHLKRFMQTTRGLQKIGKQVSFPLELDMSPFCEKNSNDDIIMYRLYGIVEHSGGLAGGHYVSYFYNDVTSKWHFCSDTHVRDCSESEALGAEAYLLFYQRL